MLLLSTTTPPLAFLKHTSNRLITSLILWILYRESRGSSSRDIDKEAFKKLRAFERYEEEREEDDDDDDDDSDDDDDDDDHDDDVKEEHKTEEESKDVVSGSARTGHAHSSLEAAPSTEWKVVSDVQQVRKIVEYLGEGAQDRELSRNLVHSFLMERKAEKDKDDEKEKDKDKDKEGVDSSESAAPEEEKEKLKEKDNDPTDASGPADESTQQRPGRKVCSTVVVCVVL